MTGAFVIRVCHGETSGDAVSPYPRERYHASAEFMCGVILPVVSGTSEREPRSLSPKPAPW